jgi:phosphoribosylaminoimidazole-succinocarboxamide synthase
MQSTVNVITQLELGNIKPLKQGKVRALYDLGDKLLLVATDRISAFDHIFAEGIPHKGQVLTSISKFWFELTKDIIANHVISMDPSDYPAEFHPYKNILQGRSMLVKKTKVVPIECIVRGYLEGSGWKEYQKTQTICGHKLPAGLKQCDKLPEILFTPSTKAEEGHDINISIAEMNKLVGEKIGNKLKEASIAVYKKCADYALSKGLILADTKFEFGLDENGNMFLVDEVLTPDSSRFWPADQYEPGHAQPSFDKQYVREYLESINWNKEPPIPHLPAEVVKKTSEKYLEAYKRLTGKDLNIL